MADLSFPSGTRPLERTEDVPSWRWPALLAAPFLICLAVLLVTGWTFPTFWGDDELSHWALIRWFAAGLPRFQANYPATATTPLFHLAGACVVRLFGENLQLARACNALLSLGAMLALYRLLRRRPFSHGQATAALLCAVVAFSSYYFGYSFRVLTDNMAVGGCLLAMGELFRFADPAESQPWRRFLRGCLWVCLTILTRQSYVFLGVPFGLALLAAPLDPRRKLLGLGALALAVAPLAMLAASWHGLTPPDFQKRHATGLLHLYPLALPVMLLGLYAMAFFGPTWWRRWTAGDLPPRWWMLPAAGAAGAVLVLIFFPIFPVAGRLDLATYIPLEGRERWPNVFGGWIYALALNGRYTFCHNPLFFWLALPIGGAVVAGCLSEMWNTPNRRHQTAAFFLLGVLFSSLPNAISVQKYYDVLVLLYLVWRSEGEAARDGWRRWLLYGLILLSCVYTVTRPILTHEREVPMAPPVMPPPL